MMKQAKASLIEMIVLIMAIVSGVALAFVTALLTGNTDAPLRLSAGWVVLTAGYTLVIWIAIRLWAKMWWRSKLGIQRKRKMR